MSDSMDLFICGHCHKTGDRDMAIRIGEIWYCEECANELSKEMELLK